MRAAGGVGPRSTDNGPELGPWWEAGGGVGRVGGVPWGGVGVWLATKPFTTRMWRGRRRGTEAGTAGDGGWGAGGGLSPAGMAGVPWGPVGAEAPNVGRVQNHDLCFRHRSS